MNLLTLKSGRIAPFLSLAALLPLLAGCPGIIELKAKEGGAIATKSTVAPILFDDFVKGFSGTTAGNPDGNASCTVSMVVGMPHEGVTKKLVRCDFKSGIGSYGPGFEWNSLYLPKAGFFDARGTVGVELWAKAPRGIIFQVSVGEGKLNGGDEEDYQSSQVTGTGAWKRYFIPYTGFTRSLYSGNQSGDNNLAVGSFVRAGVQVTEKQGDGVLYLDEVHFK